MGTCKGRTVGIEPHLKAAAWWPMYLVLVFLASAAYGQAASGTPAAPPAQAPAATVSTNVDEVSLDLVVHDKNRKLVLDLKPEDFAITDNDTPVKMSGFHLVTGDAGGGHLVTLVFDRFNGATAKSAQNVADKILKILPSKGYSIAVLDITGRLRLLQGFTEDRTTMEQAINVATESRAVALTSTFTKSVNIVTDKADEGRTKAAAEAEKNLIAVAQKGVDLTGRRVDVRERARAQTLLKALEDSQRIRQDQHAAPNLAGLLALVRSQQQVSERKAVIYFTQNMQMDSAAKEMVHTITGAANKSGVSIYVMDLNALDVGGQYQINAAMAAGNAAFDPTPQAVAGSGGHATTTPMQQGSPGGPTSTVGMAIDFNRQGGMPDVAIKSPLSDMAKDTGGAYVDAQDNVKKPLQQMLQDMTTYYQATYVPPIQEYDGSFRTISVKPVRSGLNIKAKTGYFAIAPSEEGGIRPFEAPLLKVLGEAQLPTDIKFNASVLQFGELPDGNISGLAVEVPISELQTREDTHTNLYSAHVSIVAQVKDKSGAVIEHFAEDVTRRGAVESLSADKLATITLQRHFMSIPGQYVLEVAVRDPLSEKASAGRINFEIPQTQPAPSLSDMVLVRKVDAFREEDDPVEPLRYENSKITPNLSGVLPEKTNSVSLFFILHPDPKADAPATLEMEVSRNGAPGRRTPLPLPARSSAAGDAIPYLANFRAASFAPGVYEVKATITQGGRTSARDIAFSVEGTAPANTPAGADNAATSEMKLQAAPSDLHPANQLVISALTNPIPPPTAEEIQALIEGARKRAVGYKESLPNFICVKVTNRSIDASGSGRWKHRDTITGLLKYHDATETQTVLEVDGKPAASADPEAIAGAQSNGEFGGVLDIVFNPSAKADFKWKETDTLGSGTLQVFEYHVVKGYSQFSVRGANGLQPTVGFHGLVFIDNETRSVRRVTLVADDLPKDFPTHSTSIAVDYDYVVINAHDYLVPISAEVSLSQGRREADLNTIEFRNYKRFSSNVKILGFAPVAKP